MELVGFVGSAHKDRSLNFDAQRCINLFPVVSASGTAKTPAKLASTPGLGVFCDFRALVNQGVRGMLAFDTNSLFVVSASTVLRITTTGAVVAIGSVDYAETPVSMATNGINIFVAVGPKGYVIDPATNGVTEYTNVSFKGADTVAFVSGSYVFNEPGTGRWWAMDPYALTLNPLWFATAEGSPDNLVGLAEISQEVWLFGTQTTEVWANDGSAGFPFSRIQGAFVEYGCAALNSIADIDNSIFWLSATEHGQGEIRRTAGLNSTRISNDSLEQEIATYPVISDAVGYTYSQEGHMFYVLSFPTQDITWVYDLNTATWHQRGYLKEIGTFARHRSNCHQFFARKNLVGDYLMGIIYEMSTLIYTDNGNPLVRLRASPHVSQDDMKMAHASIEFDIETGVGLVVGPQTGVNTNLLQYPRQYHLAAWAFGAALDARVIPNNVIDPNGTMTASTLTDNDATQRLTKLSQFVVPNDTLPRVFSEYIKKTVGATSFPGLQIQYAGGTLATGAVTVNTNTGVLTDRTGFVPLAKAIEDAGQYWIVSVALANNGSGNTVCLNYIYPAVNTDASGNWSNTAVGSVAVWHAQCEVGTVRTPTIPDLTAFVSRASNKILANQAGQQTVYGNDIAVMEFDPVTLISKGLSLENAARNLVIYPRTLTASDWGKVSILVAPDVVQAPDGLMTGDKIIEGASNSSHFIFQARNATNETTTLSVIAKAGERSVLYISMSNFVTASLGAYFNLATGTITSTDVGNADYTNPSSSIENLKDGWYKCMLTVTKGSVNTFNTPAIQVGTGGYLGDGVSGIYVWHIQLELNNAATSIVPDETAFVSRASDKWEFNSSGVLTQYATNVAVTAYDPVTLNSRGLSLEPSVTNQVRSSTMAGAAIGVPGTLATGMGIATLPSGINREVTAVSSVDGIDYIGLRFYGTATTAGNVSIFPDNSVSIAASSGQTWTVSMFLRHIAGTLPSTANFDIDEYASGSYVTGGLRQITGLSGSLSTLRTGRQSFTRTLSGGGTITNVRSYVNFVIPNGAVVDFTIIIGLPMLAQEFSASSPIKTIGGAVTRAADVSVSPQATRAADVSVSPNGTTPIYSTQGVDPQVMLRWSDDNGHTFYGQRQAPVGKLGQYGKRVRFTRLGQARDRVYELSYSEPTPFTIMGARINAPQ